jgi:hypothetical protein
VGLSACVGFVMCVCVCVSVCFGYMYTVL